MVQCLLERHHWPISGLLGSFLVRPKGYSMSKWSFFGTLKIPNIPNIGSKMLFYLWWPTRWRIICHLRPNLVTLSHMMTFSGAKRLVLGLLGAQKDLIFTSNGRLGVPRRAPMVQRWVSDAYLVTIDQLDHYLVFGTKSGAIPDLQSDKTCPIGVKQAPQTPPKSPRTPPEPISDPLYNQYNSSSYFITH